MLSGPGQVDRSLKGHSLLIHEKIAGGLLATTSHYGEVENDSSAYQKIEREIEKRYRERVPHV